MTRLPTCPDCGGILQLTTPERLTSTEVAAADERQPATHWQCLICGHEEEQPATEPAPAR